MIHILVLKNGGHAFRLACFCFHFKDNTFTFEPYKEVEFKTAFLVKIVQLLPGLAKEVCHEILEDGSFVA